MRVATKPKGLGLGDRACPALAKQLNLPAVIADAAWVEPADGLRVEVVMVRQGQEGTSQQGLDPHRDQHSIGEPIHTFHPASYSRRERKRSVTALVWSVGLGCVPLNIWGDHPSSYVRNDQYVFPPYASASDHPIRCNARPMKRFCMPCPTSNVGPDRLALLRVAAARFARSRARWTGSVWPCHPHSHPKRVKARTKPVGMCRVRIDAFGNAGSVALDMETTLREAVSASALWRARRTGLLKTVRMPEARERNCDGGRSAKPARS